MLENGTETDQAKTQGVTQSEVLELKKSACASGLQPDAQSQCPQSWGPEPVQVWSSLVQNCYWLLADEMRLHGS